MIRKEKVAQGALDITCDRFASAAGTLHVQKERLLRKQRKGRHNARPTVTWTRYIHVSTIITAAEVILQLCAERRR